MGNINTVTQTDEDTIKAEKGIVDLLIVLGENPKREGLKDTPKRVVKAFKEMTSGYSVDINEILSKTFTKEIAEAIQNNLDCAGVYVEVEARHMCMELRGTKARGSKTKTIYKTGCYLRGDNNC